MQFGIVPKTMYQKSTKINEVKQYLICISSKWPTFLPIYAYNHDNSTSETRRSLILVFTPMFSRSRNMLVTTISSLDPFNRPN